MYSDSSSIVPPLSQRSSYRRTEQGIAVWTLKRTKYHASRQEIDFFLSMYPSKKMWGKCASLVPSQICGWRSRTSVVPQKPEFRFCMIQTSSSCAISPYWVSCAPIDFSLVCSPLLDRISFPTFPWRRCSLFARGCLQPPRLHQQRLQ